MVSVPGGDSNLYYGDTKKLDAYWIDRYEVSNAEFKRFVEAGGYETEKFWKQPFVKDGRVLASKDAMALFKDKTGLPGPATWSLGTFPEGEGDLPVGGVSCTKRRRSRPSRKRSFHHSTTGHTRQDSAVRGTTSGTFSARAT